MSERSENVARPDSHRPTEEDLLRDKAGSNGRMPVAAVPSDGMHAPYDGLTKRELFAAVAMQGLLSQSEWEAGHRREETAEEAVKCADALLKELAK